MSPPKQDIIEQLGETQRALLRAVQEAAKGAASAPTAKAALELALAARALAEAFRFVRV